jgi:hypothetical protein
MLNESRDLDRPSGIDRVLRPMRLSTTPHAGSSGAQLRALTARVICVAISSSVALGSAAAEPSSAARNGEARSSGDRQPPGTVGRASDPQQVAMARALFEEGLRHVDAEQWALAADRFARVLSLRYSPVAAYNLALARARLGSSVLALEGLRELLANPSLEPTVRDAALSLQKEQQARVGWMTVRVSGECAGCEVQLDGKSLPPAALNVAVPVDPGSHALALVHGSVSLSRSNLNVAPGARVVGKLNAPAQSAVSQRTAQTAPDDRSSSAPAAPAAALATASDPQQPKSSLIASPWFWGGVGILAAGAVTLGVVLSSGGSRAADPVPGNFSPNVIAGEVR